MFLVEKLSWRHMYIHGTKDIDSKSQEVCSRIPLRKVVLCILGECLSVSCVYAEYENTAEEIAKVVHIDTYARQLDALMFIFVIIQMTAEETKRMLNSSVSI